MTCGFYGASVNEWYNGNKFFAAGLYIAGIGAGVATLATFGEASGYIKSSQGISRASINAVSREGVAAVAGKGAIQKGEITTYQNFVDRSVVGDGLEGHEVWQHANISKHGLATTRLSTDASKLNPVIALEKPMHTTVNIAQRAVQARSMTPAENIIANSNILRNVGVPESVVMQIQEAALKHAASLGY